MKRRLISLLLTLVLALSLVLSPGSPFLTTADAATTSQNNIVARADYMYDATWVCQKTVKGWNNAYTFYKGQTYHLPYAWAVSAGAYIGYGISVENFLTATKSSSNSFYTKRSYLSGASYSYSTYYGTDCSGFVSYCWGISRNTTATLPNYANYIGRVSTSNAKYSLQLGDALNSNSVGHVVLVTGLTYDANGAIKQIEITEQTPPQLKRSYYTPDQLSNKYYSNYYIYRYQGSVPAAPNAVKDTTKPTVSNVKVTNVTADSYKVTCTVSDNVGVTKVLFPTWTDKNGQDDIVWHTGTISGSTASFTVKRSAHNSEYGKYHTHIYAYDAAGNSGGAVSAGNTFVKDTTKPTISNVKVSNVTKDGYTVTCTVSDNVGVTKVLFPTWTTTNGQDDIVWHTGTISGSTASFTVKRSAHKNEYGKYNTHIYAYDAAGNSTGVPSVGATLEKDTTKPTISNVKVTNVTADSYTVTCTVSDNVGVTKVLFPTWTDKNGQDDIVWHTGTISGSTASFTVKRSAHNNEYGKYITHIYAYDAEGNNVHKGTNATLEKDTTAPVISNIQITNVTADSYTVTCRVSDNVGVTKVLFPTWTSKNGQDDIVWYVGKISGSTASFTVKRSDHNGEYGKYNTHIYAYDAAGNSKGAVSAGVTLSASTKETATEYYPACTGYTGTSLYDGLSASGYTGTLSVAAVTPLANLNGISNYTGTAEQNTILLNLLKAGKLIKTAAYYPACSGYTGTSLYDGLAASGYSGTLSVAGLVPIAAANGISAYTGEAYTGTAAQNTALLNLLKAGKLIKP